MTLQGVLDTEGKDQIYQGCENSLASVDYTLNEERRRFFQGKEKVWWGGSILFAVDA